MVRGYQKRVIFIKNTGSRLIEEAYFILNEEARAEPSFGSADMISEANRIIEQSIGKDSRERKEKGSLLKRVLRLLIPFVIGLALGAVICTLIFTF